MGISLLSYTRLVIGMTGTQWSSIVRQKRTDEKTTLRSLLFAGKILADFMIH